jgi:hypothetical protein
MEMTKLQTAIALIVVAGGVLIAAAKLFPGDQASSNYSTAFASLCNKFGNAEVERVLASFEPHVVTRRQADGDVEVYNPMWEASSYDAKVAIAVSAACVAWFHDSNRIIFVRGDRDNATLARVVDGKYHFN